MKPRILILESERYPLEALSLLKEFGEVEAYKPETGDDQLARSEALIARLRYQLNAPFLRRCPNLKVIVTATTGLDHIDLDHARARGIAVLSLKGETKFLRTVTATAEHTWGLLLSLIRHIPRAHFSVVNGQWDRTPFFGHELQARKLGIIGLGRIGSIVARYGLAFQMQVLAYDPFQEEWMPEISRVQSLPELLSAADVVSIHVPLSRQTEKLIGQTEFGQMNAHALLINTSRGQILDQSALIAALKSGQIAGAALDVIADEYDSDPQARADLVSYAAQNSNLLLTPHIGGATHDSLKKVEIFMAQKLASHYAFGAQ